MKVKLAGYNIDSELIERMGGVEESLTPEVLSASYARISRDPREISVLRKEARDHVEKARKSNETIVFGLGHSSIAEHAVFNFDIMDISRLAVEALESFRLAAYTEKSQRYIKIGQDFVIPSEIKGEGLENEFRDLMDYLAVQYKKVFRKIRENGGSDSVAKEDARYLLPLATEAQLGMTVNARELEYMVSRLASHPLEELNRFAEILTRKSGVIAPSLIKYPEPADYFRNRFKSFESMAELTESETELEDEVTVVSAPDNCDELVTAAILFASGEAGIAEASEKASKMNDQQRGGIIRMTLKDIGPHNSVWREFEFASFIFQVNVSASCFAQLKRHRMATLSSQRYLPGAGLIVPVSAEGCEDIFKEASERSYLMYRRIEEKAGRDAAEYALLNANRRRVLLGMNLRELYHFSRLRSDSHAQWEIRELSEKICSMVREEAPLSSILLGGKDSFEALSERLDR